MGPGCRSLSQSARTEEAEQVLSMLTESRQECVDVSLLCRPGRYQPDH